MAVSENQYIYFYIWPIILVDYFYNYELYQVSKRQYFAGIKVSSATKRKGLLINDSPPSAKNPRHESWRKDLFKEDKLSREKSSSQVLLIFCICYDVNFQMRTGGVDIEHNQYILNI